MEVMEKPKIILACCPECQKEGKINHQSCNRLLSEQEQKDHRGHQAYLHLDFRRGWLLVYYRD